MDSQQIVAFLLPYLPNLLWILFIAACMKIALGSTSQILRIIYRNFNVPQGYYMRARLLVRFIIISTSLLLMLLFIPGIDEKALAVAGIVLGVIVSLSSTTTIGNIVAGSIIHYTRPIREGDRVEIDGAFGDVVSVELMFVHIKTIKDVIVSIPSLNVISKGIRNFSALDNTIVYASLTLGYDLDPCLVEELLLKSASKTDGILEQPAPFVLIRSLNDYTVEYEINGYTDAPSSLIMTKSRLMKNVLLEFAKSDVQIMSPAYVDLMQMPPEKKIIPTLINKILKSDEAVTEGDEKDIIEAKKKLAQKKRQKIALDEGG